MTAAEKEQAFWFPNNPSIDTSNNAMSPHNPVTSIFINKNDPADLDFLGMSFGSQAV